jgi:hypothetical protein
VVKRVAAGIDKQRAGAMCSGRSRSAPAGQSSTMRHAIHGSPDVRPPPLLAADWRAWSGLSSKGPSPYPPCAILFMRRLPSL